MRSRGLFLCIIIFVSIFQNGCWDYEEYEDLAQISALGFDYDKKSQEITVTAKYVPITKGGQTGGTGGSSSSSPNKEIVHIATAKTIYEAIGKLQEVVDKKLFYGYLKEIVFGSDAAKYDILDIIEDLDRVPVVRSSSPIMIASGKAEDALSTFDTAEPTPSSQEIYSMMNIADKIGTAYIVSVQDFTGLLAIPGIEAVAPQVISVSNIPKPMAEGGIEGKIKFDESRPGDHRVAGLAAFKGDKLVGWLNDKESIGYGLITGKNIIPYIVTESPENKNKIYFRLTKSSGKIKVSLHNDKPVFQVNVKVLADMRKYYPQNGEEFLGPKVISIIEKKLSDALRLKIEAALKKGQKELKTDIFGFGFALYREDPKLWRAKYDKKWYSIFPNVPISIKVSASIMNTGTNIRRIYVR